jgi:hypothetical protein
MKISLASKLAALNRVWYRFLAVASLWLLAAGPVVAQQGGQSSGSSSTLITNLSKGLGIIAVFGFMAGCVMVMVGFLNAKRDENWKMTVLYGVGLAGSVALMKLLFGLFFGQSALPDATINW